ncbi:hypothetical protein O0L34_g11583 [Tuta absoluta]|nr:hypothetical protein O0L34_g11583 [Tuta absoluta]
MINHSIFILNSFEQVKGVFGFFVTIYYTYNLASAGFNVFMFMLEEDHTRYNYAASIVVFMSGLVMISFVLEEVKRKSDDMSVHVYNINWEEMSISNQKTVLLLLLKSQSVLQFKGIGGFQAGVVPMVSGLYSFRETSINRSSITYRQEREARQTPYPYPIHLYLRRS